MPLLRNFTTEVFSNTPLPILVDNSRIARTYTSRVDYDNTGLAHVFNRAPRPIYEFNFTLEPLMRDQAERLEAFHAFHQGGRSFLFDGTVYNSKTTFTLFGEGDSVRTEFFLPNRYVNASSYQIRTKSQTTLATSLWLNTAYSLTSVPGGVVQFFPFVTTIPASQTDIEALYANQYRCLFDPETFKMREIAKGLFSCELSLLEILLTS